MMSGEGVKKRDNSRGKVGPYSTGVILTGKTTFSNQAHRETALTSAFPSENITGKISLFYTSFFVAYMLYFLLCGTRVYIFIYLGGKFYPPTYFLKSQMKQKWIGNKRKVSLKQYIHSTITTKFIQQDLVQNIEWYMSLNYLSVLIYLGLSNNSVWFRLIMCCKIMCMKINLCVILLVTKLNDFVLRIS